VRSKLNKDATDKGNEKCAKRQMMTINRRYCSFLQNFHTDRKNNIKKILLCGMHFLSKRHPQTTPHLTREKFNKRLFE